MTQSVLCKNCDKAIGEKDGKLFAQVLLCPTCFLLAERFYNRRADELRRMLLVLKDAIRVALLEGRMHLGEAPSLDELTKDEILGAAMQLIERKDMPKEDKLAGSYVLRCTHDGCMGHSIVSQNYGLNYSVGMMIPFDETNPAFGRCPLCRRHLMKVVKVPETTVVHEVKGFTRIPET